jgi:hypothetical protein
MGSFSVAKPSPAWVAIDIAKNRHEVLMETKRGVRRRLSVENTLAAFNKFADCLRPHRPCEIAIEPRAIIIDLWQTFSFAKAITFTSFPPSRPTERARQCTIPGIRMTPKTPR